MNTLDFQHSVVCDDIRQEMNGKFLIIGMYTGAIIASDFPFRSQLAFGLWANAEPGARYRCEFEVFCDGETDFVSGIEVEIKVDAGETQVFLPIPRLPVKADKEGDLVLREAISGAEVLRIRVTSSSGTSLPPEQSQLGASDQASQPAPSHPQPQKRRKARL